MGPGGKEENGTVKKSQQTTLYWPDGHSGKVGYKNWFLESNQMGCLYFLDPGECLKCLFQLDLIQYIWERGE